MIFNLPNTYELNKRLNKETFVTHLQGKDVDRFKKAVKKITLISQLAGEDIPSVVNESYNIQAIMFLEVELETIKDSAFVVNAMQMAIKTPAFIELFDENKNAKCSFALKRLNQADNTQVVITHNILSEEYSLRFDSEFKDNFEKFVDYPKIINAKDKVTFAQEIFTKLYILSNSKLYVGVMDLLESKVWYNENKVSALIDNLVQLNGLKKQVDSETDMVSAIAIKQKIKTKIAEIKKGVN